MARFTDRMRKILGSAWIFSLIFAGQILFAQEETFSEDRLEDFYDAFLCEEKNLTAEAGVTGPCTEQLPTPPPPPPDSCGEILAKPTIPPLAAPSSSLDHVPIVLINNTNQPDNMVFFVIYGNPVSAGCVTSDFAYVDFGPQASMNVVGVTNLASTAVGLNMPPSTTYSYSFQDVPLTNGQKIIYVPYLSSGIMLFSIQNALTGLTTFANSIAIPIASDPGDGNYLTVYGGMEFTFIPTTCGINQLTFDFTCVDYYGLSIYLNLFTQNPAPGLPQNRPSGIFQSRHHTLCELQNTFLLASPAALSQWNGLVLFDGARILRVLSPGYSMSHTGGTFDPNYFDNLAYGFSWANDLWTYYTTKPLTIITNDGTQYNGFIQGGPFPSGNFVFQSTSTNEQFTIPWTNVLIAPSPFSTSTALFNTAVFFPGMTYSSNKGISSCIIGAMNCCIIGGSGCAGTQVVPPAAATRATEITQNLSAAIVAGLIPGKVNKLTPTGFPPSLINSYYTPNPNLTPPGPTTGPWYDLYSLGIHGNAAVTGNAVYTYAYDDYLYSQAPVSSQVAPSQAVIDNTTYITIILGPYSDN